MTQGVKAGIYSALRIFIGCLFHVTAEMLTCALNPKVAIFFLSFLPQFINPSGNYELQLLGFGLWFDIQGMTILVIVVLIVGKTRSVLKRNRKIILAQEKITGLILIALGIKLALTSRK